MHFVRVGLLLAALAAQLQLIGQDSLKNLPELSLPLTEKKLVIAHCMTNIIRFKGHPFEDGCNPDYYSPKDNLTSPLGGMTQVNVLEDPVLKNASLDETVEFEMRAALRSGIDAFQFYYTLGGVDWDDIIKAYFRVATAKHIPFKFTFCISHPGGGHEKDKVEAFARRINSIMDEAGRNNEHWLRTPDGRLVVYMWYGETLADVPADKGGKGEAYYAARAYRRLADSVHERFACVYSINEEISAAKLSDYLDYFPAVWIWTLPYSDQYAGYRVAATCRDRRRTFTGSVFGDFYTSKLLKRGTWDMYYRAEDAVAAGMDKVDRKQIITGLSYNFRKLWEFGISQDVPVMNIITWNDYPEGHHLAPEVNHNDGFAQLLRYYKDVWNRRLTGGVPSRDIAVVFFKKYNHTLAPKPFNIPVVSFQAEAIPASWEDSIEVVTLLKAPARLWINGRPFSVPAGINSTRAPAVAGSVTVTADRNNLRIIDFKTPEGITYSPYRSDRLTYTISSEYGSFHRDIFGDVPIVSSCEYAPCTLAQGQEVK